MSRDIIRNEQTFLGCLLRSPQEYWQVNEVVLADHFTVSTHREIYSAVRDIADSGRQITTTALLAHLPEEYDQEPMAGPTIGILTALRENAADAGSATDYAYVVAEHAARRQGIAALKAGIKALEAGEKGAEDVLSETSLRIQELQASASQDRPIDLHVLTKRVMTSAINAREKDFMPGFSTGLRGLDEITGLLMGGDFIGVIGALGEGKSALLAQVGKHIALQAPVLACHNEMSLEQNATRAVAGESGLSVREVREGAFDMAAYDMLKEGQGRIEGMKIKLWSSTKMTVRAIRARALQMKRTTGLGAITVDGLKRMKAEGKTKDRWERLEEITGGLKELAIEMDVPVLLAVQRTRTARRRDDPMPQLDDADAPTLETDADIVLAVWREESWLMMNKPNAKAGGEEWEKWEHRIAAVRGIGKIIGLKVRSGKPFEQKTFRWEGKATKFLDIEGGN